MSTKNSLEKVHIKITNIRIRKINGRKNIKAIADITINHIITIYGLKIINSYNGELFVAMPCYQNVYKDYIDIISILDTHIQQEINEIILNEYSKM